MATLRAVRVLMKLDVDDVGLARIAHRAENEYVGVRCGILDQMACSLLDGGTMLFLDTRTLERTLLPLPAEAEIVVIDSGVARSLASSKYNERRDECERAARMLGVPALRDLTCASDADALPDPLCRRARHVVTENGRALRGAQGVDAVEFGALMSASHRSLRDDYEVSIPALNALVDVLIEQPGVHGAKLTGAGFGGACVALCAVGEAQRIARDTLARYDTNRRHGRALVPRSS
jgi:galactokinase